MEKHIEGRMWWAKMHEDMVLADWKAVISSDESKFNLFGSDGRNYCRRRVGEEFLEQNVERR